MTWGPVGVIDLPNPGRWNRRAFASTMGALAFGLQRQPPASVTQPSAVSIFRGRRPHLEMDGATDRAATITGSFPLSPAVIQGRNHQIHVVYSYSLDKGQSMQNTPASMSPGFYRGDSKIEPPATPLESQAPAAPLSSPAPNSSALRHQCVIISPPHFVTPHPIPLNIGASRGSYRGRVQTGVQSIAATFANCVSRAVSFKSCRPRF